MNEIIKKLETLPEELERAGNDYALKKAKYEQLKKYEKVMLAECEKESNGGTQAEKQRDALTTEKYEKHLKNQHNALYLYLQAQARLNAIEAEVECTRSLNSIRKSETQLI